ncbi:sensor domain-containing protein [Mycobacterium angelicum]|uniref:PknH-like extracellular domain-containing protein n=1 Tax=Mycobacterium angelicum TaxID=470074 RepID=A0A1W9ZSY4_MYCAN|nr:sensor domain-containing protein [Mycobacterium angelicum]MCV7196934.1 sensor domain-containing protein [Mycobacterium angelicum]ORA20795.1 hypothetical protein BST12_14475 [Mycobacterium angelicum]
MTHGPNPFDSGPIFEYPPDEPRPQHRRVKILATASLVLVTLVIIGLVVWATLGDDSANQSATPSATTASSKASTAVTTTPAQPTVASNDIPSLLAGLDALKEITGDPRLTAGKAWHQIARSERDGTIDRPECYGAIAPGTPEAYDIKDVLGFYAAAFADIRDARNILQVIQGVAAFRDAPAATAQLAKLQAQWRQCGGTSVTVTFTGGLSATMSLSPPSDAGDGITTMVQTTPGMPVRTLRAIAAKANIVIDLVLSYSGAAITEDAQQAILGIARAILGKVPA